MGPLRDSQMAHFGVPKEEQYQVLQDAVIHHVESFNFVLKNGLNAVAQSIPPMEMALPNGVRLEVRIMKCQINKPEIKENDWARKLKIYPAECRGRGISYKGSLQVTAAWSLNGDVKDIVVKPVGDVPIMVKSDACNLHGKKPQELIKLGEEENEFGGYFIINGLEKVIRLLIAQRRNYPVAMQRSGWKKRGDLFTEFGVSSRCVSANQCGSNLVVHYLSDGTAKLMFTYKREMFVVPVMLVLKALSDDTDYSIYKCLIHGKENNSHYQGCIKNMMRKMTEMKIFVQEEALNYLGQKFAVKLDLPSWYSNVDAAKFLIKQAICVHLEEDKDKFNFIVLMVQKLFAVVMNECALESADSLMNQEIFTPGALYLIIIKEKLHSWLASMKMHIEKKLKSVRAPTIEQVIKDSFTYSMNITRSVENVFSTGNFAPRFESSLQQFSGLAVIADKLNFWRYLSHFRAVHRGAFFAQMRTTTVRKLLPEAWGFLCPVHTPDGAPCGLLNHMAMTCQVVNSQPETDHMFNIFCRNGLIPIDHPMADNSDFYNVMFDGKIVGFVLALKATQFVQRLRYLKSTGQEMVPRDMEICFIPKSEHASQYPGIFMFTDPARMMRPVKNLLSKTVELIGTMEQVYLHVALRHEDVVTGITFHEEIAPTNILSILANQIPYSDHNQSPRNMYECQMGKQTMGTPCHSLRRRSDNKLYQIRTPQSPLVRPKMHDYYKMDDYPFGTNAIVAVASYTGYDMEDAFILNKSSVDRGFKHGSIYKTEVVNLKLIDVDRGIRGKNLIFAREKNNTEVAKFIDADGLPHIGTRVNFEDPVCSYVDVSTGITTCMKYKSTEEAYIEDVKMLGSDTGTEMNNQIAIKYRVPRNPIIGDKFASRHGQKGVCGFMLPLEDMPFTESGMTPDIIFNPHGYPSRMTIGMMIESMAGKAAATDGVIHDATPFKFSEEHAAGEYFSDCLKKAGFDYLGTERMYSGVSGEELEADIFIGVVYYQRLRHMVSDKYQVRTLGPIDPTTRQPVKGRKREGGVRFGEMERDALIAHGSSFLLHDRLFTCSDATRHYICTKCRDMISPVFKKYFSDVTNLELSSLCDFTCKLCDSSDDIVIVDVPHILRYLIAELSAVNIKVDFEAGFFS